MKPRTLALATFVALFGVGASFNSLANDPPSDEVNPVQEPTPASGAALDQDDPAVASDEIFDDTESLATDDDDTEPSGSDAAASEADAGDTSMSETTASTTIEPATDPTGAQERRAPSDVKRMDSDGNGTLELAEVSDKSALKARFADYDIDKDGSLSVTEFDSWLGPDHAMTGIAATATTTTTTDSTALSTDTDADADDATLPSAEVTDADALTAQTAEEAEETESEDIGGEENRPSDAGTPDVDSDEEEAVDPDDNDD